MNTNWQDVCVVFLVCMTLLVGLAIAAWLVIEDHPWFAAFILLAVCSIKVKTGSGK